VVKLGSKVRDVISGFQGIAISRCEYLNGCVTIGIEGAMDGSKDKDGDPKRPHVWTDEQRVQVLAEGAFEPQGEYAEKLRVGPGGQAAGRLAKAGGEPDRRPPIDGAR